jgi:cytochrome c oxidase subunit 2
MKSKPNSHNQRHLFLMCLAIIILSAGLVYLFLNIDLIPNPSTVERGYIDYFIKILLSIAGVIFSIVIVVLGYSLIFFRRRPGDGNEGPPTRGYAPLETAWTIIPLAIVVSLAVYGAIILDRLVAPGPPQTELEVDVLAFRYGWQFHYPADNVTSYSLYVPVNQRILIKLQSKDVIHSFWVQEWGPKQDAVPGLTTQVRYTPTKIGKYTVQCSQLCGSGHSFMTAPAIVTSRADFLNWIQQQQRTPPAPTPMLSPSPSSKSLTINPIAGEVQ